MSTIKEIKQNTPIKTPPKLFDETQNIIAKISEKLDWDFMSYWTSSRSRIVGDDIIAFYEILKNTKKKDTLYLFIKSDGGSGETSLRIVNLLRKFYKNIIALIPLDCASAATMLALGSNEIQMGPLAYLTAVDTSLTHSLSPVDKDNDRVSVSQNELSRVLALWDKEKKDNDNNPFSEIYKYIHPLVIGAVDRATSLSIKLTTDILSYHITDTTKAQEISNILNSEYPSHSYPITIVEAKKIWLLAKEMSDELNRYLLELNELYSEMAQMAFTDFDEENYHDNEILKVLESTNLKLFFQKDKDWHYRAEERRWIPMNDESSWRKMSIINNKIVEQNFHIM